MRLLKLGTVLAGVDADETTHVALRAAEQLAAAAGAELHVVSVTSDEPPAKAPPLSNRGPAEPKLHFLTGDPAQEIQRLSAKLCADVIVLGPHRGRGRDAHMPSLGSTALKIVTHAVAPCLVVAAPLRLPLRRVIAPVDLSETARGALVVALSWASALRHGENGATTLTALRIASPGGPPGSAKDGSALAEELDRLRSEAGAWAGIAVESVTVQAASIAESIDDFASKHKADLIVMGTQGLGQGPEPRLGSVADAMVRRTNIPVLLVPPAVWRMHSGAR